ncbi:MAG: oligosaccharide flippase family protein [Ferruginibacter sp.]
MNLKKLEKYGVIILYVATIIGVGFSFLGSVLNSKMLSKELFGDWKYIQNYLMMISYFVNFGFYYSGGRLIASTDDKQRISIFKGYMLMSCTAGLVIMFLATLITGFFFPKLLSPQLFKLCLIMFPLFIIHPLMFYFESIFQSERRLIDYSIYKILPPLLYVAALYLFQTLSTGSIYYNAMLYYATYFIVFAVFILKDKQVFKKRSPELTELVNENKTFGVHLYYGSLWNVGASYLLPILIGFFGMNNVDVGPYSLAASFIIPFSFLPGIVGTSYFKQFINLETIPADAFKKVLLASAGLLLATWLCIDFVIDLFLGEKFSSVGFLVKFGAIGAILQGFGDFTNKFLSAKGRSPYIKKVAIVVGTVQIVASLFFIRWYSSTGAMVAKIIGSAVYFGCLYYYYYKNFYQKATAAKLV